MILYFVVNILCFLGVLFTLEIVWANVKPAWKERDFRTIFIYLLGGTAAFMVMIALTTAARHFAE